MKLSIVVPVYNMASGGKLRYCLDSLMAQSLPAEDYEIIAVDDASTDDSMQILRQYEKEYPGRFTAIHSPVNHHQGGAKNLGLARARGEWIGFMDSDDWLDHDCYSSLLKLAEESGADMVGCDYCLTHEQSFKPGEQIANNRPEQCGILDHEKYRLLLLDSGSLVVKLYKRHIVLKDFIPFSSDNAKVFPEDIFYEDNAVCASWMLRAKHFEYLRKPLYYYYQHDDSTVHTISLQRLNDRMTAGRLMIETARKNGYFEEYKNELEYLFTVLFYKNTLFSAMPKRRGLKKGCYSFTAALAKEMKETFPDFEKNPYYIEKTDAEEKKLMGMQMRSHLLFYLYYRLLWLYRDIRYGRK